MPVIDLFEVRIGAEIRTSATAPSATHDWPEEAVQDIQYIQNPYEDQLVLVHDSQPPKEITYLAGVWNFQSIPFPAGEEPNFGGASAYPSAVGSFQGRLFFGGTPPLRQTL